MAHPYKSYQIEPGFWCIEESGVRCFLLEGDSDALLIDAGFGIGNLKEYISSITPLPVNRLIITHADRDHVGCAEQFNQIMMHPAEFDRYASSGQDCSVLSPLWENDEISIGRWKFAVVLLSGHTPGSIALLDRKHRFLIAGDCVQTAPIYMFGQGRNLPAYIHSIDRLLELSGSFDTIFASHGELTLTAEVLPILKESALHVLNHQVDGTPPPHDVPCLLYQWNGVGFLYDGHSGQTQFGD